MNDRFSADDLSRNSGLASRAIDLAHARPFRIGAVEVRPASRELIRADRRELVEPLVMQVLVALASAKGATLTRDDLIDACWGGRAVSDDAISRVASRLRSLGKSLGGFEVETIPKIGYRLVSGDQTDATAGPAKVQRRHVIAAGGAIAAAGFVGLWSWRAANPTGTSEQAQLLIQKGMAALQDNDALDSQDPGSTLASVALLTEATRLAPQSASAWGALALAYAVRRRAVPLDQRSGLAARCRAAARRSLDLDPIEARALGAMRMLDPVYRNWLRVERADREAVAKNATLPILPFIMSDMLGSVGRWKEAANFSKQLDRNKFLIPGADRKLLIDLWASGDLQGADAMLDTIVKQWPQHPQIWRTRLSYLMYSGRANEVLAILSQSTDRPLELRPDFFETVQYTADALTGRRPADEAISRHLKYLETYPMAALQAVQALIALGAVPVAFKLLDGYYFGEGEWASLAPRAGDEDRITNPLFHPVMKSIWRSPDFARLLGRIGLEDYWRESGTRPDFRRG